MKQLYIRIPGALVPVSRKIYMAYYKARRKEKYLAENDRAHGLLSYHAWDNEDFLGEDFIADSGESVEDMAIKAIMLGKLDEALSKLSPDDKRLILMLYGDESERSISRKLGIPLITLQRKRAAIVTHLKNIFKKI